MTLNREQVAERLSDSHGDWNTPNWVIDAVLAMLAEERAELERERDEARELVRSEQHPDCLVILKSALPWLRDGWTRELESQVAALREALGYIAAVAQAHDLKIRDEALEEAASLCDEERSAWESDAAGSCAIRIRALRSKP